MGKIYKLREQREASARADLYRFMEFFEVMDEAVTPFKSGYPMPSANAGDSRVSLAMMRGKPKAKFEFLAKSNKHIAIELDLSDMSVNPQEYIENMLECLDQGLIQAQKESRIFIPPAIAQSHLMGIK